MHAPFGAGQTGRAPAALSAASPMPSATTGLSQGIAEMAVACPPGILPASQGMEGEAAAALHSGGQPGPCMPPGGPPSLVDTLGVFLEDKILEYAD